MVKIVGFHFLHHNYSTSSPLLLPGTSTSYLHSQLQRPHFHHKQFQFQQRNLSSSTHLSPALSILCRSRLWDPNAESYEEEDDDSNFDVATQALEEFIDSFWILKVFGSYGWMLPAILISLLLASGLKAFLLAMALPLLQSTFTFAFQKMQAGRKSKPKPKIKKSYKSTKKGTSSASNSRTVTQEEEAIWDDNLRAQKKRRGYGSWVSSKESKGDLGGWDELDSGILDANVRPSKRKEQKPSGVRDGPAKKIKVNRKWAGSSDTPLLLRLLISIFPFFEFME